MNSSTESTRPTFDAHVHIASRDTGRYPFAPTAVGSPWWHDPVDVDDLLRAMDGAAVERAVIVQAVGAYGYDNRYLLDACAAHLDRLVAIAAVRDLRMIDDVNARPGVVGLRGFLVGGVEREVIAAALERFPTVVLTGFLDQLDPLLDLVARHPSVPVIIDHCGFPDWTLATGAVSPAEAWPTLARLAVLSNTRVKFTGHSMHCTDDPDAAFAAVTRLFGPERVIAGSDFPQTRQDYTATWNALRRLDPSGQFTGENARRLWPDARAPLRFEPPVLQ